MKTRTPTTPFETLESRRLMSTTLASGLLSVVGSAANDVVSISVSGTTLTVRENGVSQNFVAAAVAQISVSAGVGNDVIVLNATVNKPASLSGGFGDDTLSGGSGADDIRGGPGVDTVDYSARTEALRIVVDDTSDDGRAGEGDNVHSDVENFIGGSGADVISGHYASAPHLIYGNGGNDVIYGSYNNDRIFGGDGDDALYGNDLTSAGADYLSGGRGNDYIYGDAGNDVIDGGDNDDTIVADYGADDIHGGTGVDTADYSARLETLRLVVDDTADDGAAGEGDNIHSDVENLFGGNGNDVISGHRAAVPHFINGNGGADLIYGCSANDTIFGGDGNDTLLGGLINGVSGNDLINGGRGADVIYGEAGDDTLIGGSGDDFIFGDVGKDTIYGRRAPGGIILPDSETDNDTLYGGDDGDFIYGQEGNDRIFGDNGLDILYGDVGNDEIHGGVGVDSLSGGGDGDQLFGDDGDDILLADLGADQLYGGAGVDKADYSSRTTPQRLVVDDTADDGAAGEGDNIHSDVEDLIGGSAGDVISGHLANVPHFLRGNGGDDVIYGSYADDTIFGDGGDDTLQGGPGAGGDKIYGGLGNDTIDGGAGIDFLVGEGDNDTIRGGDGDDLIGGGDGDDRLYGGRGSDYVGGDAGNDGLYGGVGASDFLSGGTGSDRFLQTFANGATIGEDTISDAAAEDAVCNFRNASQQNNVAFGGQSGTYSFAAGYWADVEIETLDQGLQVLHQATRNDNFIETLDGASMNFWRVGAQTASSGGTFSAAGWNNLDGNVFFAEGTFSSANFARQAIIHEIGHNWQRTNYGSWLGLSGWTTTNQSQNPAYVQATDASGAWWRLQSAQFVSSYAMTNPSEDFAESFDAYFANRAGWPFVRSGTPITQIVGKQAFFDSLVAQFS